MTSPKEALEEIVKGEGAFNRDPLKHAENTIDHMMVIAKTAIPVAELHEQMVKGMPNLLAMMRTAIELIEQEIPDCETFKEKAFIDKMDALLTQLEALANSKEE